MPSAHNHIYQLSNELMAWQLLMEAGYRCKSWGPPAETGPVKISFLDNFLTLRLEGTEEHAGVLVSEALSRLVRECSVTLASTIGKAKTSPAGSPIVSRPLRIVVYGVMSEKDTVKSILDEGSLFLQRPDEYDRRVRYFNPMYLLPPGEDMPSTAGSTAAASRTQDSVSSDEQELDEVEKAHILRVFDEAAGGSVRAASFQIQQSPRIISVLKEYETQSQSAGGGKELTQSRFRHQKEALAMMVEREQNTVSAEPMFPSLWEPSSVGDKTVSVSPLLFLSIRKIDGNHASITRYRHVITKSPQGEPLPSLHGGILADVRPHSLPFGAVPQGKVPSQIARF